MVFGMVNIRRLQQTGGKNGSSFLIILPKGWVVRQNLKKGDPVVVAEREDGCLIIDPRLPKAGEFRTTTVRMEPNLKWAITSKYLLGFDEIRVVSDRQITSQERENVRRIINRFVALEITDEDDYQIVVQCLVDPSTLPVHKAMRRMNLIAARMLADAISAYFGGDTTTAEWVVQRDDEVDRLFFLIVRELRSAIQYPRMAEKMNIRPVEALDFRLAAQYIERIADLAVDIAARTAERPSEGVIDGLGRIAERVMEMLKRAVSNLFKFAPEKVAWVIQSEKQVSDEIARLRQRLIATPDGATQEHLTVLDCLLRVSEASRDIADLALPHS